MVDFTGVGKFLILCGASLVLIGLLVTFWRDIPLLGRLPGDILVQKGNFRFFFPIVTCLILSALFTLLVNIIFSLIGR